VSLDFQSYLNLPALAGSRLERGKSGGGEEQLV
jgi:hypothetical protein